MTGRILLGILFLSGWFISSCLFHEYHFVNVNMTWVDAQTYCRNNYADLATIGDTTEMNQLINTVSSAGYNSEVWIGVYVDFYWTWSSSITDDFWKWENQTQNDLHFYICVSISNTKSGGCCSYENCSVQHPFICDNGTQLVFVNETMNWFRAWRYCKENFTDLTNLWSSTVVQNLVPGGDRAWIGGIRYPQTYWSDGSSSSFRYWDNLAKIFGSVNMIYGVADLQRSGKWRLQSDGTQLPFVCYNIPEGSMGGMSNVPQLQLKNEKVLQLSMSSSVDLNDPVVKANMLTELQNRLKEKGLSGVSLKWREQPDGKVFHKKTKN